MQIEIYNPTQGERIEPVKWNYEELKLQISAGLEHYKNIVYTENDIAAAKQDRADLNRLSKAIDDKRKEMKKFYLQPYEEFEAQAKELTAMIGEQSAEIDKQVKEFEHKQKVEKQGNIILIYEELIGDLMKMVPYEKIHDDKWLNKGTSLKSIRESIQSTVTKVTEDLNAIDLMGFDKTTTNRVKGVYLRRFDLADAMREKSAIENERRMLAEYEAKKAAEKHEIHPVESVCEDVRTVEPPAEETPLKTENKAPEVVQIDFRVWATREQLNDLKSFLVSNGIKYGKVV